jgi:hypothetical protein
MYVVLVYAQFLGAHQGEAENALRGLYQIREVHPQQGFAFCTSHILLTIHE